MCLYLFCVIATEVLVLYTILQEIRKPVVNKSEQRHCPHWIFLGPGFCHLLCWSRTSLVPLIFLHEVGSRSGFSKIVCYWTKFGNRVILNET